MPVRVKICGLTNAEDALCAVQAGADFLGFIFYPKSPRYVEPATVADILSTLAAAGHTTPGVGVFVNYTVTEIQAILAQTGLRYAQLHGDESPDQVHALAPCAFKALGAAAPARGQADASDPIAPALARGRRFHTTTHHAGPGLMVDAYDPTAYGGIGKLADQTLAHALARAFPHLLLAGGLTPANVSHAIQHIQPWGVDVASGVERAPGLKDHAAVIAFIRAAQATILGQ
ncbi:MAG: phosphoribosylanthranilate isomerase [Litorilinea sp.]